MSMTVDRGQAQSVRVLIERVGRLNPTTNDQIASVGFMTGALYALGRAIELRYDDTRASPDPSMMKTEFRDTLSAMARDAELPQPWLAGFYFHSATMRLAALNERLDRSKDLAKAIRQSVNSLKHDADAHISGRRTVHLPQVVKAAEDLCGLLESTIP